MTTDRATLTIDGIPVAVVQTSPDGYERAAIAVQRDLGRQWNAHPIPGNAAAYDSWTATGGAICCNELAAAAIAAADPSATAAVVELREALAEMVGAETDVAISSFGNGERISAEDWREADRAGYERVKRARAALARVEVSR